MTRKTKTTDDRGKRNLTNQIKHRMSFYKNTLRERQKTVTKIKSYAKYNLPGYKQELAKEKRWVIVTQNKITNLRKLIARRLRNGEIYKVE